MYFYQQLEWCEVEYKKTVLSLVIFSFLKSIDIL